MCVCVRVFAQVAAVWLPRGRGCLHPPCRTHCKVRVEMCVCVRVCVCLRKWLQCGCPEDVAPYIHHVRRTAWCAWKYVCACVCMSGCSMTAQRMWLPTLILWGTLQSLFAVCVYMSSWAIVSVCITSLQLHEMQQHNLCRTWCGT